MADALVPPPSEEEYNRGPRVQTNSDGIGSYIPPEIKQLGRNALDLANMMDPVQGIMAGMRDSGRAFNPELSPEERKRAAVSAALETTFAAAPVAAAKLMKAPAKAALVDALTLTGAPTSMADDISDPSRRAFMKGAAATAGVAALAPEAITEALEKVPAAVKRVKPPINPIDMFAKNIKVLRDEMNAAYDAADELAEDLPPADPMGAPTRPFDEAIAEAEKLHMDFDATTEMDMRELISEIGPKEIAGAADESLEELSQALTDFRMYSEEEYIEQMIPLAEEIQKRGLLEVKDRNGFNEYPYARTVVEDVQDYVEGSKTRKDTFGVYGLPDAGMKMTDRDSSFDSDAYLKQQGFMQRSPFETFRLKKLEYERNGLAGNELDSRLDNLARNLNIERPDKVEVFHATRGAPFTKFDAAAAQQSSNYYNMGAAGPGAYFSTNLNYPSQHVGGRGSLMSAEIDTSEMLNVKLKKPLTKPQIEGLSSALSSMPDFDGNPLVVQQKDDILTVSYKRRPTSTYDEGGETTLQIDTKNPDDVFRKVDRITEAIKNPLRKDEKGLLFSNQQSGDKQNLRKVFEESGFTGVVGGTTEVSGGPNNIVIYDTSLIPEMTVRIDQGEIPTDDADLMPLFKRADGGEMRKGVGSLSEIARRMNEGGEIRKGVGSLSDLARHMTKGGVAAASTEYRRSLYGTESSGGALDAVNKRTGALGASQAMPETLEEFKEETGRDFTRDQFKKNAGLQEAFQNWYEQKTLDYIANNGLDEYIGKMVKGVPVTLSGMMAVAHLGGNYGLRQFLETDGAYDPSDNKKNPEQGTRLSDYLQKHGGLNVYSDDSLSEDAKEELVMSQPVAPRNPIYSDPDYSNPMNYVRPVARPTSLAPVFQNELNESPRPVARPEQQQQVVEAVEAALRQSLQEKYSPEGIEQLLIGTTAEPLLPRQFQRG